MSSDKRQILDLLASGKINADEAERLLEALNSGAANNATEQSEPSGNRKKCKFLHVKVEAEPGSRSGHENVDIKIPIMLLKAGMKLHSIVPDSAKQKFASHLKDKGIDLNLNDLDSDKIEVLVGALCESSIDIDSDDEKVRIFCA
ncbi:MAG: hypothetical protein ACE5FH_11955 [Candidatus Zixiibacteriota bacterium]